MDSLPLFDGSAPSSRYDDAPARGVAPPPDFPVAGTTEVRFSGDTYEPEHDLARLTGQIARVFEAMKDGDWRTLDEIHELTGDPQASISAQLRHMRKPRFGSHRIEKRVRGEREHGLYEYSLIVKEGANEVSEQCEGAGRMASEKTSAPRPQHVSEAGR